MKIIVEPGEPYIKLQEKLNILESYCHNFSFQILPNINFPQQLPTPEDLLKQIPRYRQKPNMVLVGRFDSGKSHLANTLMGVNVLPSQYQPATRVITFVRHLQDRPSWFTAQVGILAENFWPRDEKNNQIFNLDLLNSQQWFEKHQINAGSIEILEQHGIHDHFNDKEIEGHSAIVYVDSPLLKACNIVDFPGYSDQADQISEDVKKANNAVQIADLLLYTSPINGFMNAEDFSRLSYLLRVLPTPEIDSPDFPILGNLFIIGTHAHPHISGEQLSKTLQIGSIRLYKHIENTVIAERGKQIDKPIKLEHLQRHFFPFWEESPERWQNFRQELVFILGEALPKARISKIDQEIKIYQHQISPEIDTHIQAYQQILGETSKQSLSEREKRQWELEQLEKEEPERKKRIEEGRRKVHQRIVELQDGTKRSFKQIYDEMVNVEFVEKMICDHYLDDKKQAKEYAASYLIEQLQGKLGTEINNNSEQLKEDIDSFLGQYQKILLKCPNLNRTDGSIPFDVKGAFLGGLGGVAVVGALGLWASALGNLGAYILVAKFVSLLSAVGISLGGVAPVVSFVAMIGGPLTLGIALFAGIAALGWQMFGESWKLRLAKQIVKHFEKEKIQDKFLSGIDEYWQDTKKAFDCGSDNVEIEFQKYIEHLREICSQEFSRENIENIVSYLEDLKGFFVGIPWH